MVRCALVLLVACQSSVQQQPTTPAIPSDPPPIADTGAPPTTARPILDAHNRYRASHCAPPLVWSDELAAVAQRWADHLRDASCAFEHSGGKYGENLAAGTSGTLTADGVVDMWYGEISAYDFARGGFSS